MSSNHINLVAEDDACNMLDLNLLGHMVLERFYRVQTHITMHKITDKPQLSLNKKQTIAKFEKWLKEEQYPFVTKETDNADYFAIVDILPKLYIILQKHKGDRIDLGTDIGLSSEGQSPLPSLLEGKRKSLLLNLRAELLQMHLICAMRPFDKVLEIQRAFVLVSARFEEAS
jgi:hypothetical protein